MHSDAFPPMMGKQWSSFKTQTSHLVEGTRRGRAQGVQVILKGVEEVQQAFLKGLVTKQE